MDKLSSNFKNIDKNMKIFSVSALKNTPKNERVSETTAISSQERSFESSANVGTTLLVKKFNKSSRKWKQLSADIKKERKRQGQTIMKAISPGRKIRQLKRRILLEDQGAYPLTKRFKRIFRFFCLDPLRKAREKDRLIANTLKSYPALYEPIFNLRKSKNFKHFLMSEAYIHSMALMK